MKKPMLVVALFLVCVNVEVFLGYFIGGQTSQVAINENSPLSNRTACGPFCLRIAANLYGIPCDETMHCLFVHREQMVHGSVIFKRQPLNSA